MNKIHSTTASHEYDQSRSLKNITLKKILKFFITIIFKIIQNCHNPLPVIENALNRYNNHLCTFLINIYSWLCRISNQQ